MLSYAFINGKILTVDKNDNIAEALGTLKNKIAFVGSGKDIIGMISDETAVVDLKGRVLMPGFVDSHYHPILSGLLGCNSAAAIIDTYPKNCKTLAALLETIGEAVSSKEKREWVSLMGYEPSLFPENRHPNISELDEVAPNNPVHCMHGGGHICVYNTIALAYLGIYGPEDAKKYPQNEVEVVDGKLTGMVRGHTHFLLWSKVNYDEEAQKEAAIKAYRHCVKNGITSIHDCGELGATSYHLMQKLCRDKVFRVGSYMMIHSIFGKPFSMEQNDYWLSLGLMSGLGDEHFKIGSSKFMIDGGSGGPSCFTR